MIPLSYWLLTLSLFHASPETRPQFEDHGETYGQSVERYADIAQTVARVTNEQPPLHGYTRRQSAIVLLAVAIGETGLAHDADIGPCYRGRGHEKRCDSGDSASIWQVHAPKPFQYDGRTVTTLDLFLDRHLAASVAYSRLRTSLSMCRHLAPRFRLSAYGSGECWKMPAAAVRWKTVVSLLSFDPQSE